MMSLRTLAGRYFRRKSTASLPSAVSTTKDLNRLRSAAPSLAAGDAPHNNLHQCHPWVRRAAHVSLTSACHPRYHVTFHHRLPCYLEQLDVMDISSIRAAWCTLRDDISWTSGGPPHHRSRPNIGIDWRALSREADVLWQEVGRWHTR